MMAGWDVDGVIQQGRFTGTFAGQTRDVGRWLSLALEHPGPRQVLLDPAASKIALGPVVSEEPEGLAAVAATYSLFDATDHDAHAERVVELLAKQRAARKLPAPDRLRQLDLEAARSAHAIQASGRAPRAALEDLLENSSEPLHSGVQGWTLEANRLEDLPFPEELLGRPQASIAVAVAHRKEKDDAWGRFVVLIVAPAVSGRAA
jgi:hypothetical protein